MDALSPDDVTKLLVARGSGDKTALDQLTPLVCNELHRLATSYMRREPSGHILQTSALVNEAYIRLVDCKYLPLQNRAHFFGFAAQLMRRILGDFARARRSANDTAANRARRFAQGGVSHSVFCCFSPLGIGGGDVRIV